MVNETALIAINNGSKALTNGELAIVADDTPNKDAIGLAHTPTQAPLLQHDNKIGAAEVNPPVMLVQIDFLFSMINFLVLRYSKKQQPTLPLKLEQVYKPKDVAHCQILELEQ